MVMSEINVKIRSRAQTLYNTKILMKLEDPVIVLKKKICEKHERLQESLLEAVYCGLVMEDSHPICTYNVFRGATVHVFEKTQTEKSSPAIPLDEDDLVALKEAICNLTIIPAYSKLVMNHTSPEKMTNVILNVPGLAEDPVAISLLPRFALLVKHINFDVKRLAQNHPAMASAILHLNTVARAEITDEDIRTIIWDSSNDDIEDTDDSSAASETSSPSVSRNSNIATSTVAQSTSENTSVTNQQPQPSTSYTRTYSGNHSMDPDELSAHIEFLRDIGLTDEAQQLSILLQISNMLDSVFV